MRTTCCCLCSAGVALAVAVCVCSCSTVMVVAFVPPRSPHMTCLLPLSKKQLMIPFMIMGQSDDDDSEQTTQKQEINQETTSEEPFLQKEAWWDKIFRQQQARGKFLWWHQRPDIDEEQDRQKQKQRKQVLLANNRQRRHRFTMPGGSGATSDQIRFAVIPNQQQQQQPDKSSRPKETTTKSSPTSSSLLEVQLGRWLVTRQWDATTLASKLQTTGTTVGMTPLATAEAAFRVYKEEDNDEDEQDDYTPGQNFSDMESYEAAALEYWNVRLGNQRHAKAFVRRWMKWVNKKKDCNNDLEQTNKGAMLDLGHVDRTLRGLAAILPNKTGLRHAARMVSRYPALLQAASTAQGRWMIRERVEAVERLLPGIRYKDEKNRTIHDEGNGYMALLASQQQLDPKVVFDPSVDWNYGSKLDQTINVLAGVFFPGAKELNDTIQWEQCRAEAVQLAPSFLLLKDPTELISAYQHFPEACLGNDAGNSNTTSLSAVAARVLRKCPGILFKDPRLLCARRNALQELLPKTNVVSLITSCPNLLCMDVASRVPDILSALDELLPNEVDVELLVRRAPQILLTPTPKGPLTMNSVLSHRLERLATILGDQDILATTGADTPTSSENDGDDSAGQLAIQDIDTKQQRSSVAGAAVRSVLVRNPKLLLRSSAHAFVSLETKLSRLASLLSMTTNSARIIMRKAPTLAGMDIDGTISQRCIDMTLLLRCTPSHFTSVVKRCPPILTCRAETLARKLVELDKLLTCDDVGGGSLSPNTEASASTVSKGNDALQGDTAFESDFMSFVNQTGDAMNQNMNANVSESTLAIAMRVPELLVSNVVGTLSVRAQELRRLLLGNDSIGKENDKAFGKVLRRSPELLLYNVEGTVAPKLKQLSSLLSGRESDLDEARSKQVGARLAFKEPRLLQYDVEESLVPKAKMWRERVRDPASFDEMLARYPTLLMYSFGAAARLEYFAYSNNGLKPHAADARQLLMMSKKAVDRWGEEDEEFIKSAPSLLGGVVTQRGRPRRGETTREARERRQQNILSTGGYTPSPTPSVKSGRRGRKKKTWYGPRPVEEMTVLELRPLVKKYGGKPSSKQKHLLVAYLKIRGCHYDPDSLSMDATNDSSKSMNNEMMSPKKTESSTPRRNKQTPEKSLLSYRQWIAVQLCDPIFDGTAAKTYGRDIDKRRMSQTGDKIRALSRALHANDLEKLYGMAVRGCVKASKHKQLHARKNVDTDSAVSPDLWKEMSWLMYLATAGPYQQQETPTSS